jgi:ribosomal protein S18 acetylase RimI-like enzyme
MSAAVTIRMLGAGDGPLIEAASDVFDNPADPRLTAEFLSDSRHHIAAALVGGQVVGMATAVHYVHPDKPAELWINEVGVAKAYRRQGIARQLMRALLKHARTLGCTSAWLMTEEDNEPARRLYSAVGARKRRSFTSSLTSE